MSYGYNTMGVIHVILLSLLPASILASEVCCPDVGCFQTDGPFRHLPSPSCVEKFGVKFALFTRRTPNYPLYIERTGDIPDTWASSRRTIFLIHGYMNDYEESYMINIKDKLLEKEDANVIKVDWKKGANSVYYPNSAANTRTVGAEVAFITDRLRRDNGVSQTWCIGFSLGAHTCGFAGMKTQLDRITGLDPAGPWFANYDEVARLNPSTATLVDVIHTDGSGIAAYYGLMIPSGHMDFYPNGGSYQPGCWTHVNPGSYKDPQTRRIYEKNTAEDELHEPALMASFSCSHGRAYLYFMESFDGCFVARQTCKDVNKLPGSCSSCAGGQCALMGYLADQSSQRGNFYLETTSKSPYCTG